jgi:hypothetical protein
MWYLVNRQTGDQTQCLLCNRSYKIGRVQATPAANPDIALDGDTSISRSHAELLIKFTESQVAQLDSAPSAVLTDLSKFGTFVNDTRVDEFHALSPDDLIRFGRNNCYFHLRHTPLTVTTSCVAAANRPALRQLLCQLGGHLLADWHNSCSFVVMDKLTVTVKVIAALVSQKFIVTPKYFEDLVRKADDWQGTAGVVKVIIIMKVFLLITVRIDELYEAEPEYETGSPASMSYFLFWTEKEKNRNSVVGIAQKWLYLTFCFHL